MTEVKGAALARIADDGNKQAVQLLLDLETAGAIDAVSLTLTDPEMKYETWEALGRYLGGMQRRIQWYVGDWLNFGEALFGEAASQGIEATQKERYSEAERVTGLDHGTLQNIRSICGKVAKARRRPELGFWIHAEVAPLEPDEQIEWLQRAIDEGWTRNQLREAIREAKDPAADDPPEDDRDPGEPGLTVTERIEAAARQILTQAQPTRDHNFIVPEEPIVQLREALGEE